MHAHVISNVLTLSIALTSAPLFSSIVTIFSKPLLAAQCKGVS